MRTKEPMKVRYGCVRLLAQKCKVSTETVRKALHYDSDTESQNLVRLRAVQLGYVRKIYKAK